jgi:hypothetical protein
MGGMDGRPQSRRSWPRVTLTLPPDVRDRLYEVARDNFRDPKREATRLLIDAIDRERQAQGAPR